MREKARIIAKLAAKYRVSAFFVNALGDKTPNWPVRAQHGSSEYRWLTAINAFVNKPNRGGGYAAGTAFGAVASL